VRILFQGAARAVAGSMHLIEVNGCKHGERRGVRDVI